MKYVSTTFQIECEDAELLQPCRELLADSLGEVGYESFMDTDDGIVGYVQEKGYDEGSVQQLLGDFPLENVHITYQTEDIPSQDWNATWESEGFDPIVVDGKVTIYDANHALETSGLSEPSEPFSTPITIGIQARNAFGTGTHETTRMIISTLLDTKLEGRRVLDCGCGTGILGIASLKCGASEVVGYDIDEFSSENAMHNAVLNGVGEQMEILLGDANVLSHVDGVFDVVLANINRNILLNDMPRFHEVMASDATLILSGFYEEDAPMLLREAEALGLHEISRKISSTGSEVESVQDSSAQSWCCLVFR